MVSQATEPEVGKLDLLCALELLHYIDYPYKVISLETILLYKHFNICMMQRIPYPERGK